MLTLMLAGLLALPFSAGDSRADPAGGAAEKTEKKAEKTPAKAAKRQFVPPARGAKPKAAAKSGTSSLGSAARQQLLGKRMDAQKGLKDGKKAVPPKGKKKARS